MRRLPLLLVATLLFIAFTACDTLVEDVQDPVTSTESEQLNHVEEVDFLIRGVQARYAATLGDVTVQSSLLSDQFVFDGSQATFPTFGELDAGELQLDNNSIGGAIANLGQYRFLADDLINRVETIDGLDPEEGGFGEGDDALREDALFQANLHGGIARYLWATYFGLEEERGGGIISSLDERGEFVEAPEMYQQALDRLDEALTYTDDAYDERLINSLKARIHLYQDDLEEAAALAEDGLEPGDEAFDALFADRTSSNSFNAWYSDAGPGRVQAVADDRFRVFNEEDPDEAARIPLAVDVELEDAPDLYRQARYNARDDEIDFITWQENHLMLAEAALREGDDETTALDLVNEVRESHDLDELEEIDLDALFLERDKELFTQGARLVDQRRAEEYALDAEGLDLDTHGWHLPDGTWRYLAIPQEERNDNPNID